MVERCTRKLYAVECKSLMNTYFISSCRIDNASKTPSSMDTQLESDMSTSTPSSSNYLQLPSTDTTHNYPRRDATSSHSRSTISSMAKIKVRRFSFCCCDHKSLEKFYFHSREHRFRPFKLMIANLVTINKCL